MENTTFKMLWTGGYDSTYRLAQLSRYPVTIQAYYIINPNRKSLENERKAMQRILDLLGEKEETKAKILPVIELNRNDFEITEDIRVAYQGVKKKAKLGPQYEWLSAVSREIPGLELCLERSIEKPTEYDLFLRNANYQSYGEGIGEYYILTEENDPDLKNLLGNFHFPVLIFTRSKQDFLEDFKDWGYIDIAKETWFCSQPINNEPCGYCAPCRNVVKQGMAFRMPEASMKRYKNRYFWLIRYKIIKTFKQLTGTWKS